MVSTVVPAIAAVSGPVRLPIAAAPGDTIGVAALVSPPFGVGGPHGLRGLFGRVLGWDGCGRGGGPPDRIGTLGWG